MAANDMFFITPDEPIDRKRERVLGRLLCLDENGAIRAKIETLLTGTEADRTVLVTASTLSSGYLADGHRQTGLRVREGSIEGIKTNVTKAKERHAVWLDDALAMAERRGKRSLSWVAGRIAAMYPIPKETVRRVLARQLQARKKLVIPPG
jgi:hypothetical protein